MMGSLAECLAGFLFSRDSSAGEVLGSPKATDPAKVEERKSRREKGMAILCIKANLTRHRKKIYTISGRAKCKLSDKSVLSTRVDPDVGVRGYMITSRCGRSRPPKRHSLIMTLPAAD